VQEIEEMDQALLEEVVEEAPKARVERPGAPVVVVAEDDDAVREMLVRVLGRRYTVYAAADGRDAVDLLARLPAPDAIVLDVMLPGVDGLTIARGIRRDPARRAVPFLFLTARNALQDVVDGINAGARHYLTKPFQIGDLLGKLEKMMGRAA
jgi:CheY-like chemotaxis protein